MNVLFRFSALALFLHGCLLCHFSPYARAAENNFELRTTYEWRSRSWQPNQSTAIFFDETGREIEMNNSVWVSGVWQNINCTQFRYDDSGRLSETLIQCARAGVWMRQARTAYRYDDQDRCITATGSVVGADGEYRQQYTKNTEYNARGEETSLDILRWNGTAFEADSRYERIYDAQGRIIEERHFAMEGGNRKEIRRITYAYDHAGRLVESLFSGFRGRKWTGLEREVIEYNEEGKPAVCLRQINHAANWKNYSRIVYEYDGSFNTAQITQVFKRETWRNKYRVEIGIPAATDIAEDAAGEPTELSLSVQPNPFTNATEVRYSITRAAQVRIDVIDLSGRVLMNLLDTFRAAGTYTLPFDRGSLAGGVYYMRLSVGIGESVISEEIIIER